MTTETNAPFSPVPAPTAPGLVLGPKGGYGIIGKLVMISEAIGAIEKTQDNKFDGYKFRGIDDVYAALQPALVKVGVVLLPRIYNHTVVEFATASGSMHNLSTVSVSYTFFDVDDGSSLECLTMGEGADRGDKSLNKALSSAMKNCAFQVFTVPTEESVDSENESPEKAAAPPKAPRKPRKAAPQKEAAAEAPPADDSGPFNPRPDLTLGSHAIEFGLVPAPRDEKVATKEQKKGMWRQVLQASELVYGKEVCEADRDKKFAPAEWAAHELGYDNQPQLRPSDLPKVEILVERWKDRGLQFNAKQQQDADAESADGYPNEAEQNGIFD
jgi:hypothetical protein